MSDLQILQDYIRNEVGYAGELDADLDLLEKQVLDSFNVVQWAMFIQDRFNVQFEAEDLIRENLCSFARVLSLIASKRTGLSAEHAGAK